MALPSKRELNGVIMDILTRARDDDRLGDLTVRIVLREIATHYGLEEDVFHSKSYKPFIKDTVYAAMNSFNSDPSDGDAHFPKQKVNKAVKEDGSAKAGKRKRRSTVQARSSNEERPEGDNASENEASSPKKASARSPSKQTKPGKTSKKPESDTKYKSKAIIESSDEEVAPESSGRKSVRSPKKEKTSTKSSPPKQKQQRANKTNSDIEMDPGEGPVLSSFGSKLMSATVSPKHSVSEAKKMSGDPMESELSSVIDEAPTKRHRKEQENPEKPQRDEKTKRGKKKEALSKEEETVNKLKSIVVACGVRKVWKKEFEGLDKPSQQIKRLHSILGDLGMTTRYSMEKAKTIKERRELAQELKEVQEFDKAMKRSGKGLRGSSETAESMDQGDSDAEASVRKKNARASIMAFLQDQSEEE